MMVNIGSKITATWIVSRPLGMQRMIVKGTVCHVRGDHVYVDPDPGYPVPMMATLRPAGWCPCERPHVRVNKTHIISNDNVT